jgi:hypothetical protein
MENNLDQVMDQLDSCLDNVLHGCARQNQNLSSSEKCVLSGGKPPLFRAVVPVRFYGSPSEMPAVPLGLATTDSRGADQILKMGGVCERWFGRRYGLQIFFFP